MVTSKKHNIFFKDLERALCNKLDAIFKNVENTLVDADETVAQSIELDLEGRTAIDVQAWANTATDFTFEASYDRVNWQEAKTYTGVTKVNDGFITGMRYFRLKSAVAGTTGDKVSLVLQGGR